MLLLLPLEKTEHSSSQKYIIKGSNVAEGELGFNAHLFTAVSGNRQAATVSKYA